MRIVCVLEGISVPLSENLACFVFLKQPFWVSPFCTITNENILQEIKLPVPQYCWIKTIQTQRPNTNKFTTSIKLHENNRFVKNNITMVLLGKWIRLKLCKSFKISFPITPNKTTYIWLKLQNFLPEKFR